jgi:hypothetical protein
MKIERKPNLPAAWTTCHAFLVAALLLLPVACAGQAPGAAPTPKIFDSPAEKILTGNLLASKGREDYDYFGGSLDFDGDLLVTGAPLWNSPEVAAGRAYIFRRSAEGEWRSEATLTTSDRDDGFQFDQHFGASVGVNSTEQLHPPVVAVGAPGTDDSQAGDNTGAVYIYEYDGRTWVETAKLTPSRIPNAKIGQELSLSGNILAVSGSPEAGEVYSFQREAGGWHELAPVTVPASPDGEPASVLLDLYGNTLTLSTFTVQPVNQENYSEPHQRTGVVTLYERSGDQWKQIFQTPPQEAYAPIVSDGFTAWDENPFGLQVSIGGEEGQASWLAVGKPGYTPMDSKYGGKPGLDPVPGSVVLYERGDRGWVALAELRLAPGELVPGALPFFISDPAAAFFGSSVDIEGNRLAVVATFANTVDIFERQGRDLAYRYRISPGTDNSDDFQLRTAAMSGSTLLLGSPSELGSGEIIVFNLPP